MNDMNELTNKLQQLMVPKAALIAYEYRENRYGNGMHYLCLLYTSPSPRDRG